MKNDMQKHIDNWWSIRMSQQTDRLINEPEKKTRKIGRTTKQMLLAPIDAFFVWCNSNIRYPKMLARSIGRCDLKIIPDNFPRTYFRGLSCSVVVDHETCLTREQTEQIRLADR